MKVSPIDGLTARHFEISLPLDRPAIEAAQMRALRATLAHAREKSSWYRDGLAAIDPQSLHSPADLACLPLMSAAEVAEFGQRMLCVPQGEVARIITLQTSGSTGPPKRLHFTRADLDGTVAFFLHGMFSLISPTDTVLALLPFAQPDSTGDLLIRALAQGGVHCAGHWPPTAPGELADVIQRENYSCVAGLPQHLLALAYELPFRQVRSMLLCSDYAPPALRARIEMICGCETFVHYGTTETGLGGGVECEAHDGCHLRECDLFFEIVDPVTGESLPEGALGEVVVTTLGRQAMPLVRYRTGDLARLTTESCVCGGVTARLYDIHGRSIACRLAGGGELTSQILDDALFALDGLLDYRATVEIAEGAERLRIDFLARDAGVRMDADMAQALTRVPVVAWSVERGLRVGSLRQVTAFASSHTVKRIIVDTRGSIS